MPSMFSTLKSIIKSAASPTRLSFKPSATTTTSSSSPPQIFNRAPSEPTSEKLSPDSEISSASSAVPQYVFDTMIANKMQQFSAIPHLMILSKMGDGAFSNVYRAYDEKLSKEVAVKVVEKSGLNASQKNFIHKEVSILRACKHPNVVQLFEFVETRENFFLVLELVSGGELFNKIIDNVYFSEPVARHIVNQVAAGIAYLHKEQGVVHRDIKPENLLFEPIPIINNPKPYIEKGYAVHKGREGEGYIVEGIGGAGIGTIKIADFGLSKKVLDSSTMTPCGTVGYTAPEIVKDEKYSYSVDMWALGCVLYTLLCGFPPFYDEDIHVLTEKVARGYFEFLSPWWDDISTSAKSLVSQLLAVNPAKRYTAETFFTHPWTRCSAGSASLEQQPLPSSRKVNATPITPSVTLKEAFDVSYAVHMLQDDESSRRHGDRSRVPRSIGKKKVLDPATPIPKEFNYEAMNHLHDHQQRTLFSRGVYGEEESTAFNLNMNKSTLIGKRKVKINPSVDPSMVDNGLKARC